MPTLAATVLAIVTTLAISRILMLAFKTFGDNMGRVVLANGATLIVCVMVWAPGIPPDMHRDFEGSLGLHGVPAALWALIDVVMLNRRQRDRERTET